MKRVGRTERYSSINKNFSGGHGQKQMPSLLDMLAQIKATLPPLLVLLTTQGLVGKCSRGHQAEYERNRLFWEVPVSNTSWRRIKQEMFCVKKKSNHKNLFLRDGIHGHGISTMKCLIEVSTSTNSCSSHQFRWLTTWNSYVHKTPDSVTLYHERLLHLVLGKQ